ncbi:MAG: carbonic anhydrase [Candidatus ainarchaeum sp.]|nr:carbonic anhydrase [Candidatus ainarchaeum sp.]
MASAETVLSGLLKGAEDFRAREPQEARATLAKGQSPGAAILYCSDSRETAEKLFGCDRRGEVFGIRLAGNVASREAIQSAVYAVEHLHVPLLMVLGHTGCGAVGAKRKGGEAKLAELLSLVEPDERLNVRAQVKRLIAEEAVAERVEAGKLVVVGALHDLESGAITELVRVSKGRTELAR